MKNRKEINVLVSCGPIPARLDSVKFITNRFKGGLAFKTAQELKDKGYNVTIVKWRFTQLPDYVNVDNVIDVIDVMEYFNGIKANANSYNAFVLAAAVANLMPSDPYKGKFPSHEYKVGDKFDIKFEIAPRIIDAIKHTNPRCALIGYKLFDAETDEELIEIGRHTLHDSKANVIFANTPATAKTKKIALTQDNAAIPMTFNEHIEFIDEVIQAQYFATNIIDKDISRDDMKHGMAEEMVKCFERISEGFAFGTVAFKSPYGIVTTPRGHKGSYTSTIFDVNFPTRTIMANNKATLNAPLLWKLLENEDDDTYVVHRHFDDPRANPNSELYDTIDYKLPGTVEEVESIGGKKAFKQAYHGYIEVRKIQPVDWTKYYQMFPSKYFSSAHPTMLKLIDKYCHEEYQTLEIGGNSTSVCKFNLDPNMPKSSYNITYEDLKKLPEEFDFILLRNSINYLSIEELELVRMALKPGGVMIANGFRQAPLVKGVENEVAVQIGDKIVHSLVYKDQVYRHEFYARGKTEYLNLGFDVKEYGMSSILIQYIK